MKCPHCGADHPEQAGRFCERCGMSVVRVVEREDDPDAPGDDEERKVRCRTCGVMAEPPVCPGCGSRLRTPDDWKE